MLLKFDNSSRILSFKPATVSRILLAGHQHDSKENRKSIIYTYKTDEASCILSPPFPECVRLSKPSYVHHTSFHLLILPMPCACSCGRCSSQLRIALPSSHDRGGTNTHSNSHMIFFSFFNTIALLLQATRSTAKDTTPCPVPCSRALGQCSQTYNDDTASEYKCDLSHLPDTVQIRNFPK